MRYKANALYWGEEWEEGSGKINYSESRGQMLSETDRLHIRQ